MKILNLYAGIGGNRKLWGDEHEITAVEYKPEIAKIYSDFFPKDTMVIADAHQYLLKHFEEYDFIWSSPPCPTHSRITRANVLLPHRDNTNRLKVGGWIKPRYPKMELYEEIIFLKYFFQGKWCVENVIAYYDALIPPVEFGGHWFWTNFPMPPFAGYANRGLGNKSNRSSEFSKIQERTGFDLSPYKGIDKRLLLRNCVEPELGKHILDWAMKPYYPTMQMAI